MSMRRKTHKDTQKDNKDEVLCFDSLVSSQLASERDAAPAMCHDILWYDALSTGNWITRHINKQTVLSNCGYVTDVASQLASEKNYQDVGATNTWGVSPDFTWLLTCSFFCEHANTVRYKGQTSNFRLWLFEKQPAVLWKQVHDQTKYMILLYLT